MQATLATGAALADAQAELTAVIGDLAEAETRAETRAAAAARAEAALAERDSEVRAVQPRTCSCAYQFLPALITQCIIKAVSGRTQMWLKFTLHSYDSFQHILPYAMLHEYC